MSSRILLSLAVACLLSACTDRPATSAPATADAVVADPAANVETSNNPPPVSDPAPSQATDLPADFIVSTNEPFWQATVQGNSLALVGPGAARSFTVESNTATTDGRRVLARDAVGSVEATISNKQCQDDMSGATFPYTGSLAFDGAAASRGCARSLADPLPVVPEQ